MTTRRALLASAAAIGLQPAAAQQRQRSIGFLTYIRAARLEENFLTALTHLGFGSTNARHIERFADRDTAKLRSGAEDLVAQQVDLIVAGVTPAILAAKRATATIPIVMLGAGDPVATGLVASLARPGGNVTGVAGNTSLLAAKTFEGLQQIIPTLRAAAVFVNTEDAFGATFQRHVEAAARSLGIQLEVVATRPGADLAPLVAAAARRGAQALVLQPTLPRSVIEMAMSHKLPTTGPSSQMAYDGCLLAYGGDPVEVAQLGANYVARILRGAKPADLPVQVPSRFELVLNLASARRLGLTVPHSVVLQAANVLG